MKYEAVIFDLGGTLVHNFSFSDYAEVARKIAAKLSTHEQEFVDTWFEESTRIGTGEFRNYQDFIRHVCKLLGVKSDDTVLDYGAALQLEMTEKMIKMPLESAVEVLVHLKDSGYKTGLISDCGTDIPRVWDRTPFASLIDIPIFSCDVGMNKANPEIFRMSVEQLEVEPEQCLYVADGMRDELTNASKLGMRAIQVRYPGIIYDGPWVEDWDGPVVTSLQELLAYLD